MGNFTVYFFPKRKLTTPPPPVDGNYPATSDNQYLQYAMTLTLKSFNESDETNIKESTSLSGIKSFSYFYSTRTFSCETLTSGENDEPDTDVYEMFFASVIAGEDFYITNLDTLEDPFLCTMLGRSSKARRSNIDINKFSYSFNVRESV
tara:strand:- start:629 stop:1075 length:447 start_codon:yes stop_codon:yes gene_type:complete